MYQQPDKDIWKGRLDTEEEGYSKRWHEVIQFLDLSQPEQIPKQNNTAFALLGFCCDEGVKRNKGRVGAAEAPDILKSSLTNLPIHNQLSIWDAGNVICSNGLLEDAQGMLAKKIKLLLDNGFKPVVFGGGHEVAYGHYKGVRSYLSNKEAIGIINLDAHFDLRSYSKITSSGTPFLQISDGCKRTNEGFHYLCLGIQKFGNTKSLFEKADALGVNYFLNSEINWNTLEKIQRKTLDFIQKVDHVYLTVDIDVFSAAFAPGVSAANGNGLSPDIVRPILEVIYQSQKVISIDFAEFNPKYDIDKRAEKLVASLVFEYVNHL